MRKLKTVAMIVIAAILLIACSSCVSEVQSSGAQTIPPCQERDIMSKFLMEKFGEKPLIRGTAKDGADFVIYVGNGTWTMTRAVNKRECFFLIGHGNLEIVGPEVEKAEN